MTFARTKIVRIAAAALIAGLLAACASRVDEEEVVTIVRVETPPSSAPNEVEWQGYFDDVSKGAILVRLDTRRLSYWSPGAESYREFPVAIAEAPELERVGRAVITRRRENPDWTPTPSMRARNPELPAYMPPGPENPLGAHALYLDWQYYAIHGTNDLTSVGRATTSGCIRLFPEHIAWLYEHAAIGTPVLIAREG